MALRQLRVPVPSAGSPFEGLDLEEHPLSWSSAGLVQAWDLAEPRGPGKPSAQPAIGIWAEEKGLNIVPSIGSAAPLEPWHKEK